MDVMGNMLANMLSKINMEEVLKPLLPAEALAVLSPENIQGLKNDVAGFASDVRHSLARIEAQNIAILTALEKANNVDKLNVPDDSSGGNSPSRRRRSSGSVDGAATS